MVDDVANEIVKPITDNNNEINNLIVPYKKKPISPDQSELDLGISKQIKKAESLGANLINNRGVYDMTYEERLEAAKKAKNGDNWVNIKTGKTVIVKGNNGRHGIKLLHQSGRQTTKQEHYFAYEYIPINKLTE